MDPPLRNLCITDTPLVAGDRFDQRVEFLPIANSKLLERSACDARDKRGTADRELQIDNRPGLLVDCRHRGRKNVEYANPGRLPNGKRYVTRSNTRTHPVPDGRIEMGHDELPAVERERRELIFRIMGRDASIEDRSCLLAARRRLEIEATHPLVDITGRKTLSVRENDHRIREPADLRD